MIDEILLPLQRDLKPHTSNHMTNVLTRSFTLLLLFLCCALAALADGRSDKRFTLVIDAGHGGHDAGAVGAYSKEKNINLNVALAFGRLVEANCPDVRVVYTRKTDVFIPLQRRADIANAQKADLFISIHTNALPAGRTAYGAETYTLGMARASANLEVAKRENSVITYEKDYRQTYQGFDPNRAESYVIFEFMQDKHMKQSVDLAKCIQKQYVKGGRPDKGVHQAGFLVLRNTSMPAVLTELGFISTPSEENYLNSRQGVDIMSRSLYNGFLAYRRQHSKSPQQLPADLPTQPAAEKPQPVPATDSADVPAVQPVSTVTASQLQSRQPTPADDAAADSAPAAQETAPAARQHKAAPAAKSKPAGTPAKGKTKAKPAPAKPKVTYHIQVAAGKLEVSVKDKQFKGLPVTRVKVGGQYRFYYGTCHTYAEAQKALKTAQAKLPGAYMVAFVGNQQVTIPEARAQEKKR